jgi:hypothetical protein
MHKNHVADDCNVNRNKSADNNESKPESNQGATTTAHTNMSNVSTSSPASTVMPESSLLLVKKSSTIFKPCFSKKFFRCINFLVGRLFPGYLVLDMKQCPEFFERLQTINNYTG